MDSEPDTNSTYPKTEDLEKRVREYGDPVAQKTLSARGKRIATGGLVAGDDGSQTGRSGRRVMSALVQRLAARLGSDPDELAKRYGEDTVRRTKFPVVEEPQDDGKILYKHNPIK